MTNKHTPAPWHVEYGDFDKHQENYKNYFAIVDSKGSWVGHEIPNEEDAALIVKAVNCHYELLAALEGMMNVDASEADWKIARAAIQKAKGE